MLATYIPFKLSYRTCVSVDKKFASCALNRRWHHIGGYMIQPSFLYAGNSPM